ncbi:long-chain-acyl-CoA synthetase [Ketobacter alkanivorans]|uniref:Long-chain-acyl-CoA synthetase n=1 Tax=Ketobacter alkanivorans TaxID=1917421 RepID=A0A2K9LKE7_9GAMM|nr:long-chain-acyl-CoA synthetase [Ketobacter alkanivorans]AUM12720.1 long-chain-acyl-CoA synthetase [Ketobacter alkanivorans]MCP5013675.1 long-chain-acyl-CoA synthetase [Ketobacter sp.]
MNTNKQVSLSEITTGMLRAVPDAPAFFSGVRSMLSAGPEKKMSIGLLLEKQARRHPASPALKFEDKTWSYASFNGWVNRIAALFEKMGVGEGDVVAIMSENRPEMLACTAAAVKLGAIAGMLNYNQRDEVLTHSLGLINPKVLVVGDESVEALENSPFGPMQNQAIRHIWLGADPSQCPLGYEDLETLTELMPSVNPITTKQIQSKQPCFYIFTSGTTGMPKASVMSHGRWLKGGAGMGLLTARMTYEDTIYVPLPLYHNNALTVSWGSALASGACVALTKKFSVSRFWDEVRQHEATVFCYIGELCRYLLNREVSEQDRQHNVRVVIGNGLRPEIWMEFKERFGIERICEFYGASECNLAFVNSFDVDCTAGFCPLPFAVVECDPETEQPKRDSNGKMHRVETGGVGLLITKINKLAPFDGYTDASASEKKLLRDVFKSGDCWFNTGDLVRDQGFKHIQFVDRLGDTFRWKGENVATTEVEAAFKHVDQIEQAVVYGVQVPNADGRAGMAAITLHGSVDEFDGKALAEVLSSSLPAYAVPLFVRVRDEHEITGTFKNRKVELKKEGFDPARSADPVFMLDQNLGEYTALSQERFQELEAGKIRL